MSKFTGRLRVDMIHCYFTDDACYYEALGNMDIARSIKTDEIVGVTIPNIRGLLKGEQR